MQSPICTVNITNKSRSGWTRHNLWNLLTINFKNKYFHNFGQGFICKCISLHDWKNEKWLLKNLFVKLPHPWHELIINPPCRTPPTRPIPIPNKLSPIWQKGPSILYGGHYPLAPLENHVGIYAPSVFAWKRKYWIWQKRLHDRIGQWVEALYKTWNVAS